jgi:5,10-methylenetetrahydromethanopterin reductase
MALARAADRTSRIGLGIAVAIPAYRQVMTNTTAVATLVDQALAALSWALGPAVDCFSTPPSPARGGI